MWGRLATCRRLAIGDPKLPVILPILRWADFTIGGGLPTRLPTCPTNATFVLLGLFEFGVQLALGLGRLKFAQAIVDAG